MEQRGFRVHGRVQGVGFRWWTRSHAQRLGIGGSVRNHEDGTVEIRARGTADSLDELRRLLHQGPPGARVEQVEEEALAEATPTDVFTIER